MPDLERLTDDFALHASRADPIAHAFERGRIAGKRAARRQVAVIAVVVALAIVAIHLAA